jgi:putative addiction module component (TIGR02574 family)
MTEYDSILAAAHKMPIADQLRLIDELAATLPDDQPPALTAEWLAEIERRSAEIDAGKVSPEGWPQIRERLFTQVGLKRAD